MKVSCVIALYNEAKRVGAVLDAVVGHNLIDETIVVNDGSTDNSKEVLERRPGIQLISYAKNKGKTKALMEGIRVAKHNTLLLLDADLVGLRPQDVTALLEPVLSGEADATISLRKNSLLMHKLLGLDLLSGERVFDKRVLGDLEKLEPLPSFGFEAYLNRKWVGQKLRLRVVHWPQVAHTTKAKKFRWWEATLRDIDMFRQVFLTVGVLGFIVQNFEMYFLKRKGAAVSQGYGPARQAAAGEAQKG